LEAFDEFYPLVKHKPYPHLIVKSTDRQLAEELMQQTFLKIRRSRLFHEGGLLRNWMA